MCTPTVDIHLYNSDSHRNYCKMARLSIGSQHFHAKDKISSTLSLNSPLQPESFAPTKNPDIDNYMVQNKLLSMKNSELTLRVADLESRITQLVTENVVLQSNTLSKSEANFKIQNTLDLVESVVAEKFAALLQELKEIRAQEELPQSNLLTTLLTALASCRPVTSTPRADREFGEYGSMQTWGGLPLVSSNSGARSMLDDGTKERSVSVASLADLAMLDDLEKSISPENRTEQNNVGKLLLPELSTRVSVFSDQQPGVVSTHLGPIDEGIEPEEQPRKRTRSHSAEAEKATPIIKTEIKSEPTRGTRKRRPLSNVTNKRRSVLRRRAKTIASHSEEVPDSDIFEFVD